MIRALLEAMKKSVSYNATTTANKLVVIKKHI